MTSKYINGMVVYDDPSRRAIGGHSRGSAVKQFRLGSPNSITADWRECPRMTSKYFGLFVESGG